MDRHQRLTELLQFINDNGDRESNFHKLYERLLSERDTEEDFDSTHANKYLKNLRATIKKTADAYITAKDKRTNCYKEFQSFVSHFKQDVTEGLRSKPSTDTTIK